MKTRIACLAAVALLTAAVAPFAMAQGIRWTDAELTRVAEAVVTGSVRGISTAQDPDVGYIYTYVTVELDDVIKGRFADSTIVVKQLGGRVGDLELVVYDQAAFSLGEEVLLFLTERPRDRTVQTVGLWQGKWSIERDPSTGVGVARRPRNGDIVGVRAGALGLEDDARLLGPFREEMRAWLNQSPGRSSDPGLRTSLGELPEATVGAIGGETSAGFTLLGSGSRWHEADAGTSVQVDIQDGGQPGLAGGGVAEIATARSLWNNGGSSLHLAAGDNHRASGYSASQLCRDITAVDGRLAVYFDDPCNEIGNDGTLAIGGFYASFSGARVINGTNFRKIIRGFVINSGGAGVQSWLRTSRCFQDVQTHELGHAIGLGHTSVAGNIMNPTIDGSCRRALVVSGAVSGSLGADDLLGLRFIYPGDAPEPPPEPAPEPSLPAPPSNVAAVVASASQVNLTWADNAADEDGFKMQRQRTGEAWTTVWLAANQTSYADTGLAVGTWCYRIRAFNDAGHGVYVNSTPQCVTLSAPGPAAPSGLVATPLAGGRVQLRWQDNSNNEKAFKMQRRVPGGGWQGIWHKANATSYVDSGLAAGSYCYRIRSVKGNQFSSYTESVPQCVVVTAGAGSGAPSAPSALVAQALSGGRVSLQWVDNSNNERSFKMQRRVAGGTWLGIWHKADATAYVDRNLAAGTYCYRIRSVNGNGHSSYTNSAPNCVVVGS